jgi:hypothetical protein
MESSARFRAYLPEVKVENKDDTAITHTEKTFMRIPLLRNLQAYWERLYVEPFRGISADGKHPFTPKSRISRLIRQNRKHHFWPLFQTR